MARYIGLHTLPGFTREMLAEATPHLDKQEGAQFLKAYSSFAEGRVVCEWEAGDKDVVAKAYDNLGFPYDSIHQVEAICDMGIDAVDTKYV
ncbi:MAG: nickel-binding protein [Actinomycetota bacterium]